MMHLLVYFTVPSVFSSKLKLVQNNTWIDIDNLPQEFWLRGE